MTDLETAMLEALRVGVEMRTAQVDYFRAPRGSAHKLERLRASKALEARFDKLAKHAVQAVAIKP